LNEHDCHAELTDEELMAAYARGDLAAHRALFARLAPPIRGVALKALRDPAEADDIVQHTFLQLHRARLEFRSAAKLRPWVFTIAMNLVRDALRRRKRTREVPLVLEGALEPSVLPVSPIEAGEDAALLHEALAALPEDQRRAIELHWWEGRSFAEVARIEGASESAVKVRAHRGYRRMREWLETTGRLLRT
jgi:RNA polymerase sigma-70 factor (ECF subfamily)